MAYAAGPSPRGFGLGHARTSLAARLFAILIVVVFAGCTGDILDPPGLGPGSSGAPGIGPDGGLDPSYVTSTCPSGQTLCSDRCVDAMSDPSHCGSCGAACPQGLFCNFGQCTRLCPAGEIVCGDTCIAGASDLANCGSCGRACGAGEYCSAGTCTTACAYSVCETAAGLECVDTLANARHCGACNAACPPGQSCVDGFCQTLCPEGRAACNGACVATATNAAHCGSCNVACPGNTPCIGGSCGCPVGQGLCNGQCVDTLSSAANCGACGNACTGGTACVNGQCICPSGTQACPSGCADVASDTNHCGACGRACSTGEICDQGMCRPASAGCSNGLILCGTGCVDRNTSNAHCGACNAPCPTAQACSGGTCACPGGGRLCGGSCVDTLSSNTHCGACDAPCGNGRSCVTGVCQCPNGQSYCGGACVDTLTSATHCGACDAPCDGGRACAGGTCQCPNNGAFCAGACVDTLTDSAHCGTCNTACTGGAVCVNGGCACPGEQELCDGQCVNPDTSVNHCGGCGQSCFEGEVCSGGRCQGPLGADGCGALARNLTVSEIAAYQTVKIPIMTGQQAIAAGSRVASVVQGRETLFRVFVSVQAGWIARELSARLTLINGATEDQYFAKKTISGNSTDSQTTNTFQIFVPPDKVQEGTRYSVEVVECGDATGTAVSPRFPASGDVDLGTRRTGPLKVTIIPIFTNNRLPDTSATALGVYRAYLAAMYPATDVQLTVGGQISTSYPINWSGMLDQVRSKRQQDGPPSDVYYYGFVRPTETLREYCQSSCTAGIGYVGGPTFSQSRAAAGLAYGDEGSAKTMAHELGHNHGRNHAPCARGSISGVDSSYPHDGGLVGVWGYDPRTRVLIDPSQSTDIMSYCSNQWVSDYTYRALTDRVAIVNGSSFEIQGTDVAMWRVVLLDALGPRWGLPYVRPEPAFGTPEQAEILDAAGNVVAVVTVYRTEVADVGGATVLVPEPKAGWTAVRLPGFAPLAFSEPVTVPAP